MTEVPRLSRKGLDSYSHSLYTRNRRTEGLTLNDIQRGVLCHNIVIIIYQVDTITDLRILYLETWIGSKYFNKNTLLYKVEVLTLC